MSKTTPSASYLLEEDQDELRAYALHRLEEFTATLNTTQKIDVIFNAAKLAVKDDKEKHIIEWLHACILRSVTDSTSSMVTQGTYGAIVDKKAPAASKPRGMKPPSHQAKPKKFPGIVVSPYEDDDMESTVEQALTIAQQQKKQQRQNGSGISEGESDISASAAATASGKNNASSKKKRKNKQKRGKKGNGDNNTLTVKSNEGGLTAPTSWYSGYDSATTDGSVTDGGESDVSRNSTSRSRRNLGKKIRKGSLQPGAGYDAIVEKMTGSTQDVMFVKPFFFPDHDGKSFDAFISVIYAARERLYVCVYDFTDDDVATALIKAKQRNVNVRIISDDEKVEGQHADVKRLHKDHGIPYRTDNHVQHFMHNKFAIIDGKILITGSYNWSKHARYENQENIIITNVPNCVQAFEQEFECLWKQFDESTASPEKEKKKKTLKNGNGQQKSSHDNDDQA
ncbi:hypothetical protein O0I10_008363 [Lichtheimia ornata]|uniref:Mitochondrial cardiolipin hydrolase n=1 Tax=Lichtheimia ornata TaxID=688661 RepID=A0AAD7UYD8_9FUNG|nr:uncharacterized protein O0I10_008363 [Lichtheimia ornata]KAJ8655923.1 hypothetical protein O0I10_008363 [Lichtheimia ornata]